MENGAATVDLAERWRRARRAAVAAILGPVSPESEEASLFECAGEAHAVELNRLLFENSARLGEGFRRYYRKRIELEELPRLLPALGSPCLRGAWKPVEGEGAWQLEREPCREACTAVHCDAWREAIDGLVLGLTGEVRHTRHASLGHRQSRCVDLVYSKPDSPLRFGSIPGELRPVLDSIGAFAKSFRGGVEVTWLGLSEGVLLYELSTLDCAAKEPVQMLLEQTLQKRLPGLELRELSPKAVLERPENDSCQGGEAP